MLLTPPLLFGNWKETTQRSRKQDKVKTLIKSNCEKYHVCHTQQSLLGLVRSRFSAKQLSADGKHCRHPDPGLQPVLVGPVVAASTFGYSLSNAIA
jgi:hypothetical protein